MSGVTYVTRSLRRFGFSLIAAAAIASPAFATDPSFVDASATTGVSNRHNPSGGFRLGPMDISPMTAGGGIGDFNNDGFQDIYVITSGGAPDRLFINNGNGTFTDRAAAWGIAELHMGLGCAIGDYNGDGWLDIFVSSVGTGTNFPAPGLNRLYRNNGNNTFTNVAVQAGVATTSPTMPDGFGSVFGDYDLDGDLDLYTCCWLLNSGGNCLFRNNGNGTFTDVSDAAGVRNMPMRGFSPNLVDTNGDFYPELIVSADFATSRYYRNNANGTFTDLTLAGGLGRDGNGMGAAVADIDGDLRIDWYVTSIFSLASGMAGVPGTGNMLYLQNGTHLFNERSVQRGVNDGGWGWGTLALDANNDGRVDLLETNGWFEANANHVFEWRGEQSYCFRQNADGTFTDIAIPCGLIDNGEGRGMVNLDMDNDGDMDIVTFNYDQFLTIFRNDTSGAADAKYLRVFLNTGANPRIAPNGVGARVIATAGGRSQLRVVGGTTSFLGAGELSAHFGLGSTATIDELRVEWPNGVVTTLNNVAANQTMTISAPGIPGDLNCDGRTDNGDIDGFVLAITNEAAYRAANPRCDWLAADFNGDSDVDSADIDGFVDMLLGR